MWKTSGEKGVAKMLIVWGKITCISLHRKHCVRMLIIFGENPSIDKGFWTFQHFPHPLLLLLLPNIYWFLSTLRRGSASVGCPRLAKNEQQGTAYLNPLTSSRKTKKRRKQKNIKNRHLPRKFFSKYGFLYKSFTAENYISHACACGRDRHISFALKIKGI